MQMYEALASTNIIRPVVHRFKHGQYRLVPDREFGGYRVAIMKTPDPSLPWVFSVPEWERNCSFWYSVLFEDYNLLPHACGSCWKVCMKLDTLHQLFGILTLQKRMGHPSKCGMDTRPWVDALYSAYWYSSVKGGLEEARKLWKRVKRKVHKEVDPNIKVILKRA